MAKVRAWCTGLGVWTMAIWVGHMAMHPYITSGYGNSTMLSSIVRVAGRCRIVSELDCAVLPLLYTQT